MHQRMLDEIVKACRSREAEGDCPTTPRPAIGHLEDAVIQLAADKENLLPTLASAMRKFRPGLAELLLAEWQTAERQSEEALHDFLAFLRSRDVSPETEDQRVEHLRADLADQDCTGWTCPRCSRHSHKVGTLECPECGFDAAPFQPSK